MNMITKANLTQMSVSTWNINENEENPANIPTMVFTSSHNGHFRSVKSRAGFGYNSYRMQFGDDKSRVTTR